MKKILFLALTIAVALSSCKKDDPEITNYFKHNGEKYEIEKVYIETDTDEDGIYHDIILLGNGFSFKMIKGDEGEQELELVGKGNIGSISFLTKKDSDIEGNYTFSSDELPSLNKFQARIAIGLDAKIDGEEEDSDKVKQATSGTLKISKSSKTNYIIECNCDKFSIYYDGSMIPLKQ